jgi:hypothetical protein
MGGEGLLMDECCSACKAVLRGSPTRNTPSAWRRSRGSSTGTAPWRPLSSGSRSEPVRIEWRAPGSDFRSSLPRAGRSKKTNTRNDGDALEPVLWCRSGARVVPESDRKQPGLTG